MVKRLIQGGCGKNQWLKLGIHIQHKSIIILNG